MKGRLFNQTRGMRSILYYCIQGKVHVTRGISDNPDNEDIWSVQGPCTCEHEIEVEIPKGFQDILIKKWNFNLSD